MHSLFFFFYCSGDRRDIHSFPTRRSSDLEVKASMRPRRSRRGEPPRRGEDVPPGDGFNAATAFPPWRTQHRGIAASRRSEEHTSELQSLRHLVCRLLLEKKKK